MHIKDLDADGGFVPFGEGILDVAGVMAALREDGFDGWVCVETDGWDGDPSQRARTSGAFLDGLPAS